MRCKGLFGKKLKQGFLLFGSILWLSLFVPALVRAEGIVVPDEGEKGGSLVTIDANRKYDGMNAPFSKGYEPSIQKDAMLLIVPFVVEQGEPDKIIVGISFEREENSPFYYKNYQKKVKKSKDGVYLYQCRIQLKENRINGQYPLHLFVQAQALGERMQQEFTVYVEITDGVPKAPSDGQLGGAAELPSEDMPIEPEPTAPVEEGGAQPEEQAAHQPRAMIFSNSLQSVPVQAGTQPFWSLAAKNCSRNQSMENVKVTMVSDHTDISFEKNSWYFERAKAGETMDLSQNITVGKKAAAGSISIQFQFEYEDKKGTAYTSTETVNLSVVQVPHAELTGLSFPEDIYEADTDLLTFQVQNTGLAVIYNARVCFDGKGLFSEKELFLGNLEAGASVDGEISVFAGNLTMDNEGNVIDEEGKKYGKTTGTVVFSYENEQGELVESSQELHITIKKPQIVELKVEKEVPKTNQWWITILAGVFLVLILVIVWLYLRMKHYQKVSDLRRGSQQSERGRHEGA